MVSERVVVCLPNPRAAYGDVCVAVLILVRTGISHTDEDKPGLRDAVIFVVAPIIVIAGFGLNRLRVCTCKHVGVFPKALHTATPRRKLVIHNHVAHRQALNAGSTSAFFK